MKTDADKRQVPVVQTVKNPTGTGSATPADRLTGWLKKSLGCLGAPFAGPLGLGIGILAFGIFLVSLLWCIVILKVRAEKEAETRDVMKYTANLARVIEEHTVRTIREVDQVLLSVIHEYSMRGTKLDLGEEIRNGPIVSRIFSSLRVIDERGNLIAGSQPFHPANLADVEYFRVHVALDILNQPFIGKPVAEPESGKTFMQLSRRINKPNFSFGGVAVAAVDPHYFSNFYSELDLGTQEAVTLVGRDGIVRARRYGEDTSVGQDLSKLPLFDHLKASEHGSYLSVSPTDRVSRIFSYRALRDYPMIVVVGVGTDEALAGVNQRTRVYYRGAALISLIILVFTATLMALTLRQVRLRRSLELRNSELVRAERSAREREHELQLVTEHVPAMIAYFDADLRCRFANQSYCDLQRIAPERIVGMTLREIVGEETYRVLGVSVQDLAECKPVVARRVHRTETGDIRHIEIHRVPDLSADGTFRGYYAMLLDVTERKRAEQFLQLEFAVASGFAAAGSESTALESVIRTICEAQGWDCGRYLKVDEQAGVLRLKAFWHVPDDAIERFVAAKAQAVHRRGVGLAGRAWQSGEPTWAADINEDARALGVATALDTGMRGAFHFPVISEGKTNGVLAFNSRKVREPDERLLQMVHTIGSQVGQFVVRMEQRESIARLNRVYAVLSGINSLIVRVGSRQELFNGACQIAVEHGGFGIAWIGMLDPETSVITPIAYAGIEEGSPIFTSPGSAREDLAVAQGEVGRAIREKRAIVSNDIAAEPDIGSARRKEAIRRGYRSTIALPLITEGRVVGNLSLLAKEPECFTGDEVKLLEELAGDVSFALQNIGKAEKLEKLARVRAVSGEVNAAIVRIHEREALLNETCRIATVHGKFEMVWVASLDREKQEIRPVAWSGFSPEAAHGVIWATISTARGTLEEAIRTRRLVVRNDVVANPAGGVLRQEAVKMGCLSTVGIPFVVDDIVVAFLALYAPGRGFFDHDELALLNEVAADVSFALQSIARQEQVELLSYYDVLTGLPNRTLFLDRCNQHLSVRSTESRVVALILLDVERVRMVNETLGRHGGDELLRLIAQRLEHAYHGKEYLARVGGDGFGVVMRGMRDAAGVAHAVENQLLACFSAPFDVNGTELRLAAKVGLALFPTDGSNADTLFKNAEAALKKAKGSGDRYMFYAPEMNARAGQVLSLEMRLRKAVEARQFVLHYQPKYELASGRLCGLEALIRWQDPESGLVPPGDFIPLLEETGLIIEVGRWALAQALATYNDWKAGGYDVPRIAVNVSAIQLRNSDFLNMVIEVVQQVGNIPMALELEITESLMMTDINHNIRVLSVLRDMGIQIAMDDFGTGYSSLSYLARLPIDMVKIDRAFIKGMANNPQDRAIVTTIIALTHSLGLRVIAEGVETVEQSQVLKQLQCDEAQGFLFSKPLPADQIEPLLLKAGSAMPQRTTGGGTPPPQTIPASKA